MDGSFASRIFRELHSITKKASNDYTWNKEEIRLEDFVTNNDEYDFILSWSVWLSSEEFYEDYK